VVLFCKFRPVSKDSSVPIQSGDFKALPVLVSDFPIQEVALATPHIIQLSMVLELPPGPLSCVRH